MPEWGTLNHVNADDQDQIAEALVRANQTAAAAESVTGGNVSAALSAIEGASDWFLGGVVAYAGEVKFELLGVERGPVITATSAQQMAEGVARLLGAEAGDEGDGEGPQPGAGVEDDRLVARAQLHAAGVAADAGGVRAGLRIAPRDVFVLEVERNALTRYTASEIGPVDALQFVPAELVHYPTWDRVNGKPRTLEAVADTFLDRSTYRGQGNSKQLRVDGVNVPTKQWPRLNRFKEHTIELPVADFVVQPENEDRLRGAIAHPISFATCDCS